MGRPRAPCWLLHRVQGDCRTAQLELKRLGANAFTRDVLRDEARRESNLRSRRRCDGVNPPLPIPTPVDTDLKVLIGLINAMPMMLVTKAPSTHPVHADYRMRNLAVKWVLKASGKPAVSSQ